jgi:hypothetical protein
MTCLTDFEIWQVVNMTAQSVLLLATFLGALYVGVKQYQINKQLIELQHQPSIEIAATDEQLQILNKGTSSIWLWGTHAEHSNRALEGEPRLITPQGFYYIPLDALKANILGRIGQDGEEHLALTVFIKTADGRKYTVRSVLFCKVKVGNVEIHSQTIAVDCEDWPS